MTAVPDPPWWRRRGEPARDKRPLTRERSSTPRSCCSSATACRGSRCAGWRRSSASGAASLYWHVGDKEELLSLLLDRIVGEAEVPEPDPENWQGTVKELARATRRHLAQRRDAAQLSLGRDPRRPELAADPRAQPGGAGGLRAAAAGDRLRRRHVRALRRRVRLRGEPAAPSEQASPEQLGAYWASLPPEQFPTHHARSPATWSRATPTSASSSRSNCSSADSKRWARQLSVAVRTGSEVGVVEPPTGSVLTSTVSTSFEVAGHRRRRRAVAARREERRRRLGRVARAAGARPCRSCPPGVGGRPLATSDRAVVADLELGRGLRRSSTRTGSCGCRRRRRTARAPTPRPTISSAQASAPSAARGQREQRRRRTSGAARAPARASGRLARGRQQRGLALDLGHDPRLQRGRREHRRRRDRQRLDGDAQLVDLGAAGRAGLEVRLVAGALVVGQGVEHVGARGVFPALVIGPGHPTAPCASTSRIFFRPRRMRPFTVPTGASSISAISTCVKPPK